MRFVTLRLENWKDFRKADLTLQERAFLVGPNAAGKSNLLDALRLLRDIAQSKGGGLQSAVEDLHAGYAQIRSLHARKQPTLVDDVTVGDGDERGWRYRLELDGDKQGPLVVAEDVWRGSEHVLHRPDREDDSDPERLRQTHLEQVSRNQGFRTLADFFAGVTYLHRRRG